MPTPEQVQALLTVEFPTALIESAIEDAQLMLGDCLTSYPDPRASAIVKYLAAHLLASSQAGTSGNLRSESVDGVSHSFAAATLGEGLKGTSYGQQALLFDTDGCLSVDGMTEVKMYSL